MPLFLTDFADFNLFLADLFLSYYAAGFELLSLGFSGEWMWLVWSSSILTGLKPSVYFFGEWSCSLWRWALGAWEHLNPSTHCKWSLLSASILTVSIMSLPCSSLSSLQDKSRNLILSFYFRPSVRSFVQLPAPRLHDDIYSLIKDLLLAIPLAIKDHDLGSILWSFMHNIVRLSDVSKFL